MLREPIQEKQLEEIIAQAVEDDRLSCARAFEVAEKLQVPVRVVGDACNRLGIRINHCQLGCFD